MELKTTLDEELTRRYQTVKQHSCMNSNNSVIAYLISREYSRIERLKLHRVFMPKEIYALVEKTAEASGATVDEFIAEFCDETLRKAKEGVKHGKS